MSTKIVNHPHLTAIKRTDLSVPARYLVEHGLLKGRILDFGCGWGYDTDELKRRGYDIVGYDNYYRNDYPEGKFDTILCVYVLNVLEPYAQAEVMMRVSHLLSPHGTAYFAVRRDLSEEGFRLHKIYQQYTYQCNVRLPFASVTCNKSFELYQYRHFNQLERVEGEHCPFCRLSRKVEVICETATCVAFYDGYPVSPGHALIVPKRHVASYFDLTNHEREAMNVMLQFVKRVLDRSFHPDGYNIGINVNEAAGQSVFHVHMHLIPRYKGDVAHPKGGVRGVIPQKQSYGEKTESGLNHGKLNGEKAYSVDVIREKYGNAYMKWEKEADELLARLYGEGKSISELSDIFERNSGSIRSRLRKLKLIE